MYQSPRGTFDILPDGDGELPGSLAWTHLEGVIREGMRVFGFEEIRTPMFEPVELIARGVGAETDIVQKEMFVFKRGEETFVLRPEVTAPVMRAYAQHHLDQRGGAQRLFYIGPCFRAEKPQKGRYRQFHQFGVEVLGSAEPSADVEMIANLRFILDSLGVADTRLRINTLGDAADRPRYRDALETYFQRFRDELTETSQRRLDTNPLRILDTKNEREREILQDAPRLPDFVSNEARAHHDEVLQLLEDLDIPFSEDPFLVRGLDYYTRTVFELESDSLGAQNAIGGGGRYDGLAEAIGLPNAVPAAGYSAGIERLLLVLSEADYPFPERMRPDAFLVTFDDASARWAVRAAQELRSDGLRVEYDLQGRSWRKQMKEADRQNAHFAVIVGPDDLEAGAAQVREMVSGEQRAVPFSELSRVLSASVTSMQESPKSLSDTDGEIGRRGAT